MASDYDQKFEDMKKYIPFLDNMISRLETCHSTDNPRQAQLNKIRALRDLLMEKNKRMKMENLNKCEQVLKNLYAKVEQSDSLSSLKGVPLSSTVGTENTENKTEKNQKRPTSPSTKNQLRSVCNVVQNNPEGVLFHRRPKKDTSSPIRSPNLVDKRRFDEGSQARRNYTRVLVSPETSRMLYHRREPKTSSRSPINSPHKKSPSYKKLKKSSRRRSRSRKPKDINITINVPDKSLNSLNAEDIIERIKKCDDNDVDLDILQGIRKQLFHELKQTGINPDITDFIMQSYGKKKKRKKGKQKEYEEGELSDSESEYIERVYDNIVTDFQSKSEDKGKIIKTSSKTVVDSDSSVRKIKINFTIAAPSIINDFSEKTTKECTDTGTSESTINTVPLELNNVAFQNEQNVSNAGDSELFGKNKETISSYNFDKFEEHSKDFTSNDPVQDVSKGTSLLINTQDISICIEKRDCNDKCSDVDLLNTKQDVLMIQRENKANFYKPTMNPAECGASNEILTSDNKSRLDSCDNESNNTQECAIIPKGENVMPVAKDERPGGNLNNISSVQDSPKDVEIKKSDNEIISHIDILAALKKDILNESLDISNKSNEIPALHQPKLIKVTGKSSTSFEIDRKKRISLEKYKEKTNPVPKLFVKEAPGSVMKEEKVRKQSRGLTAKECERFNFRKDILEDDSWDECDKDDDRMVTTEYDVAFAPKSPEQNTFDVLDQIKEPIIIPTESSANSVIENAYFDTDMRVLDKGLNQKMNNNVSIDVELATETSDRSTKLAKECDSNMPITNSLDPRTKNDNFNAVSIPLLDLDESESQTFKSNANLVHTSLNDSINSLNLSIDNETLKEVLNQANAPFSPRVQANAPFSPRVSNWDTRNTFDKDLSVDGKKVSNSKSNFLNFSNEDRDPRNNSVLLDDSRFIQDQRNQRLRNDRDPRLNLDRRSECPRTPSHYFGKTDYPQTPTHPFGRADCPMTPVHSFGMSECPSTPIHPFGRSECPPTPTHPFSFAEIKKPLFGLMDVNNSKVMLPNTYFGMPSHPFGSSEMPSTPHHSFGAPEMPGTPRHPFGNSEMPSTPHHSFGAPETSDIQHHAFGASEMPSAQCSSFGYSEIPSSNFVSFGTDRSGNSSRPFLLSDVPRTPIHPFGRTDYSSHKPDCQLTSSSLGRASANYSNETQQNRRTDYSLSPAGNEGNRYDPRRYHQNVNRSHLDYNNEINREQSIGRNDFHRDRKCDRRRSQSQFREVTNSRRENSTDFQRHHESKRGRNQNKPFREASIPRTEDSITFRRDNGHGRGRSEQRQNNETIIPRRENSIGRNNSRDCTRGRSYSREDSNINNSFESLSTRNTLDVESHAGRSFTIDTSVNRTFQVIQKPDMGFNDKRRRASSVGRSLNSAHRSDIYSIDHKQNKQFFDRRNNFRRARSMGRDCDYTDNNTEKNDFEHYKRGFEKRENIRDKVDTSSYINAELNKTNIKDTKHDRHSNKEFYKKHDPHIKEHSLDSHRDERRDYKDEHKSSTARCNNSRDPRLQKSHSKNESRGESNRHRRSNERWSDSRKHGIVYTNDNITSGTVIGPGSGVKNYRIPKLKRVVSDSEKNDSDESTVSRSRDVTESSNSKSKESTNNEKKDTNSKSNDKNKYNWQQNKEKENSDHVIKETKHQDFEGSSTFHNRKTRIRKLSSDSEFEENSCERQNYGKEPQELSNSAVTNSVQNQIVKDDDSANNSESTFVKSSATATNLTAQHEYDMEIFNDFTVSESAPSTEINQLIANLDKDLDSCNNTDITDTSTDKLLQSTLQTNLINIQTEEPVSNELRQFSLQNETESNVKVINSTEQIKKNNPNDDMMNKKNCVTGEDSDNCNCDKSDKTKKNTYPTQEVEINSDTLLEQSPIVSSPQKDQCLVSSQINNTEKDERSHAETIKSIEDKVDEVKIKETIQHDSITETDKLEQVKDDNISLVSTSASEVENKSESEIKNNMNVSSLRSQSDAMFIPDSTVNATEGVGTSQCKINDTLPDSTNDSNIALDCNDKINDESQKEFDKTEKNNSDTSQRTTETPSVNNLLTILQGKSKIKELLNMLTDDESPKADKIRRKLEILSEIVSDEEENEGVDVVCDNNDKISETKINIENVDCIKTSEEFLAAEDTSAETLQPKTNSFRKGYKRKIRKKTGKMKGKPQVLKSTYIAKRTTRSETAAKEQTKKSKAKNPMNRELMKLQEDIKEMFISDEVLNATGIRMCRLAKLVDDNTTTRKKTESDDSSVNKSRSKKSNDLEALTKDLETNPLVVLEKVTDKTEEFNTKPTLLKPMRKKPGPKPKNKVSVSDVITNSSIVVEAETKAVKYKPGPLSKTRHLRQNDSDGHEEIDFKSVSESSEYNLHSSESESETLASLKKNHDPENIQNTTPKMKGKRRHWNLSVPKNIKKRKVEITQITDKCVETKPSATNYSKSLSNDIFTDKNYCFYKNQTNYGCRFCDFVGSNIVHHYKYEHPHDEIPISRINPIKASEAIKQSLVTNLESLIKIPNKKHVCRFCLEIFSVGVSNLECFFWHIVSKHTGEYEQPCTLCPDERSCVSTMTKPKPPDKADGLILGHICGECNYTQVSLDNLKYHINTRHDDPNIKVYQISLGDITQKALSLLEKNKNIASSTSLPTLRSLRSNTKKDISDDKNDITETSDQISESDNSYVSETAVRPSSKYKPGPASKKKQTKISFEYEDTASETSDVRNTEEITGVEVKQEKAREFTESRDPTLSKPYSNSAEDSNTKDSADASIEPSTKNTTCEEKREGNLFYGAHFKINVTASGVKEYICCVNGLQNHYKTTLMISLKKHVQMKHKEPWDGYCCVCKVIVTTLGVHRFQDCLSHFLQNHMDDFPTSEDTPLNSNESLENSQISEQTKSHNETCNTMEQTGSSISSVAFETTPKKYINVRPLSDLQQGASFEYEDRQDSEPTLMRIENVVSLNPSETRKPETAVATELRVHPESMSAPSVGPVPRTHVITPDTVGPDGEWTPSSVTDNKHRIVLETMMEPKKLVQIFKCAGKFCSFTSDSAEMAIVHATMHQRTGGVGSLRCTYCTFEALGSGIDLVAHVFREHGHCQYACRNCFYRASSALLVEEHVRCSHPTQAGSPVVLRAPLATPAPSTDAITVLSRADAVPEYVCTYGKKQGGPEQCKFRTYTLGKFLEHYKQRHPDVTSYECAECETKLELSLEGSTAAALAHHYRSHGLRQYHCTYCVFGVDSERELIAHAAHAHPARRPQAYLRHIVEAKGSDGNPKLKVLPLVHFNKGSCASLLDVEANSVADDPVKEASRALDLEKLLGETALMIEQAMTGAAPAPTSARVLEPTPTSVSAPRTTLTPLTSESRNVDALETNETINTQNDLNELRNASTPRLNVDDRDRVQITLMDAEPKSKTTSASLSFGPPPTIKTEPQDDVPAVISLTSSTPTAPASVPTPPIQAPNVICLNSDDENDRGTSEVINLSDNDDSQSSAVVASQLRRVPLACVYKCVKCAVIIKTGGGFKRHLATCCPRTPLSCAYCTFRSDERDLLADHQMRVHGPASQYSCFYCRFTTDEMPDMDRHVSSAHGIKNPVYNLDPNVKHYKKFIVRGAKPAPRTKSDRVAAHASTAPAAPPEAPARRRYGPADIDALPIAPILDEPILCAECDFDTKVRVNMVRHLQLHAERQPAPRTAPVNPVPHLETNEKHFDKMTNLAASSNAVRVEKPSAKDNTMSASLANVRYPQFVPERSRHACGAPDCSYISVDEAMLRRHWEALHSTSNVYRCVHCPPDQQLDPALPLTSARIVSHLRMHDNRLYACSGCNIYYHYHQQAVERHIAERHPFGASVITLRQPAQTPSATTPSPAAVTSASAPTPATSVDGGVSAPTMDLKPWQCGLCDFKSMLRAEVVEHCGRVHNSKMQYKCAACTWRGTIYDGASKHCAVAHPGQTAEVLHLYYREGSVPGGPDGTPLWVYQRRLCRASERPAQAVAEVKLGPIVSPVDLNLVKNEMPEETETREGHSESAQSLMERYDKFCEPRASKFACPMCNVSEDSRDAMTAHLYEELNYRKWSCSMCTYKAFHKVRLMEHALLEHCQTQEPTALPADQRIEGWVEACLKHQERLIQPTIADQFTPTIKTSVPAGAGGASSGPRATTAFDTKELEDAFGAFGAPKGSLFSCPKCVFTVKEEEKFKDHLEYELAKVRWCCSLCPEKFHRYHEAQLHCKSVHSNPPARAVDASRDPERRAAWVAAVVRAQGLDASRTPALETVRSQEVRPDAEPEGADNSLLVVRYEEHVTASGQRAARKRRPLGFLEPDSDDERLVIDEHVGDATSSPLPPPASNTTTDTAAASNPDSDFAPSTAAANTSSAMSLPEKCPFCDYTSKVSMLEHLAKHYNLKPYVCAYCGLNGFRAALYKHQLKEHGKHPRRLLPVKLPLDSPLVRDVVLQRRCSTVLCLLCGAMVLKAEAMRHAMETHPDEEAQHVDPNSVVVRCDTCGTLRSDEAAMKRHRSAAHPDRPDSSFTSYKLPRRKRAVVVCDNCTRRFRYKRDFYAHHTAAHPGLQLRFTESEYSLSADLAAAAAPASESVSSVMEIIDCDDDENDGPAAPPSNGEDVGPDAFSAGVVPTITAVTSLASDGGAKRKLPKEFDGWCAAAPPLRRVAKKSTTRRPSRTDGGRARTVARKSTTQLPLYYVESDSEREEAEDEEDGYSCYGRRPAPLSELAHLTALMPVPLLNTLMSFTIDKLSELTDINPKVLVRDLKSLPTGNTEHQGE